MSLSERKLELATSRPGFQAQVYCILQIAYFKAKHAFFRFLPQEVESYYDFVARRYFREASFPDKTITAYEHYTQRQLITDFFGSVCGLAPSPHISMYGQRKSFVVISPPDSLPLNSLAG